MFCATQLGRGVHALFAVVGNARKGTHVNVLQRSPWVPSDIVSKEMISKHHWTNGDLGSDLFIWDC